MTIAWDVYESPLGPLTIHAGARGLTALWFPGRGGPRDERRRDPAALADATAQLDEYFRGDREAFDLPLDLGGTPFQRRVWGGVPRPPPRTPPTYGGGPPAPRRPA